jgi:hypothetical protein
VVFYVRPLADDRCKGVADDACKGVTDVLCKGVADDACEIGRTMRLVQSAAARLHNF